MIIDILLTYIPEEDAITLLCSVLFSIWQSKPIFDIEAISIVGVA